VKALYEDDTTMTLCFTPEHLGIEPHNTSPPKDVNTFADFARWAVARYAPLGGTVNAGAQEATVAR
jgi:hypothetical protein